LGRANHRKRNQVVHKTRKVGYFERSILQKLLVILAALKILLVEHQPAEQFIAFAKHEGYLKTAGHRAAALEDSRLLPITPK